MLPNVPPLVFVCLLVFRAIFFASVVAARPILNGNYHLVEVRDNDPRRDSVVAIPDDVTGTDRTPERFGTLFVKNAKDETQRFYYSFKVANYLGGTVTLLSDVAAGSGNNGSKVASVLVKPMNITERLPPPPLRQLEETVRSILPGCTSMELTTDGRLILVGSRGKLSFRKSSANTGAKKAVNR